MIQNNEECQDYTSAIRLGVSRSYHLIYPNAPFPYCAKFAGIEVRKVENNKSFKTIFKFMINENEPRNGFINNIIDVDINDVIDKKVEIKSL